MTQEPKSAVIGTLSFAFVEMIALRSMTATIVKQSGLGAVLPNDFIYNLLVLLIAGTIGYFIGRLLFQIWRAKFWIKLATAGGVIAVSLGLSYWISLIIYRSSVTY